MEKTVEQRITGTANSLAHLYRASEMDQALARKKARRDVAKGFINDAKKIGDLKLVLCIAIERTFMSLRW